MIDLNILSCIKKITFQKINNKWKEDSITYEYYIVQPTIKNFHLKEGIRFLNNEEYFKNFNANQKNLMIRILDIEIKEDIMEQIIILDTERLLGKWYDIFKPEFYISGQNVGQYNMLIYDNINNVHWSFEIKHSTNPCNEQSKNIRNKNFQTFMQYISMEKWKICIYYIFII